jgi:hypothetical protein
MSKFALNHRNHSRFAPGWHFGEEQVFERLLRTVVSRIFRTFVSRYFVGRLLSCGCFAPGPHGGGLPVFVSACHAAGAGGLYPSDECGLLVL